MHTCGLHLSSLLAESRGRCKGIDAVTCYPASGSQGTGTRYDHPSPMPVSIRQETDYEGHPTSEITGTPPCNPGIGPSQTGAPRSEQQNQPSSNFHSKSNQLTSHCSQMPRLRLKKTRRLGALRRGCRKRKPAAADRSPTYSPCRQHGRQYSTYLIAQLRVSGSQAV